MRCGTVKRETSYAVPYLKGDKKYEFRVRAENYYGASDAGPVSNVVLLKEPKEKVDYDKLGKLGLFLI